MARRHPPVRNTILNIKKEEKNPVNDKNNFYRSFEERYRGSRELIKSRLQVYIPFVDHCLELYEDCAAIDLGCGRGEWLELMKEKGLQVYGIDLDEGMLSACKERNLPAIQKDALQALKELPNESQVIVSGFHIAEHLPFDVLQNVVQEALRVLKPGGLLILETPNPENIQVGSMSFYSDPSHLRPLPPTLLSFLPEFYGFARTKILRLQKLHELLQQQSIKLQDVLTGVSPDYSVVAQKKAKESRLKLFDDVFSKTYGVTLEDLSNAYNECLNKALNKNNKKIEQIDTLNTKQKKNEDRLTMHSDKLEVLDSRQNINEEKLVSCTEQIKDMQEAIRDTKKKIQELNSHVDLTQKQVEESRTHVSELESRLNSVYSSRSWKMTRLYRWLGDQTKACWQKIKNAFKPALFIPMKIAKRSPALKKCALFFLRPFPKIRLRLSYLYKLKSNQINNEKLTKTLSTISPLKDSNNLSCTIIERIRTDLGYFSINADPELTDAVKDMILYKDKL